MITGTHTIIFSRDPEADRAFFRDVLGLPFVDAGGGWLIFALPPAEAAVHQDDRGGRHELYLLCEDIDTAVAELESKGIRVERKLPDPDWGRLATIHLPGGGELGIYQPKHPLAPRATAARPQSLRGRHRAGGFVREHALDAVGINRRHHVEVRLPRLHTVVRVRRPRDRRGIQLRVRAARLRAPVDMVADHGGRAGIPAQGRRVNKGQACSLPCRTVSPDALSAGLGRTSRAKRRA